jgi:hypothetical protein
LGIQPGRVLTERLDELRTAIAEGVRVVAETFDGLPATGGWTASQVTASFGVTLTGEGNVIITKASVATTFEITVTYGRS